MRIIFGKRALAMDLLQFRTLILAIILTIHAGLVHIEEEQHCLEEFDCLLLEYSGGQAGFCMEVNACINVGALTNSNV